MEYAGFLKLPHQNDNALKIISWNINGAKSKLENMHVYNFLSNFDIISLNEVKSSMYISIPGYVSYKSKHVSGAAALRGGTVVFVRNYLSSQIYNFDNNIVDQVWLQIQCVPDTMFGFCYIPPTDSPYFSHQSFVALHEKKLNCNNSTKFCIIGDLNARFGNSVRNISLQSSNSDIKECMYPHLPDDISTPNDNAYLLSTVCIDNNFLVLNNVKTPTKYFPSQKTFKRRNQWISELDTTIVSYELLNCLSNFTVHQTDWLPSDHAPISVDLKPCRFNIDRILLRASCLGGHGALMGQHNHDYIGNRPIRFGQINLNEFSNTINNTPVPNIDYSNINTMVSDISNMLYEYANNCRISDSNIASSSEYNTMPGMPNVNTVSDHNSASNLSNYSRWERLLRDPDDSRVWKAIDWKGQFIENATNSESPSDNDFKTFMNLRVPNISKTLNQMI